MVDAAWQPINVRSLGVRDMRRLLVILASVEDYIGGPQRPRLEETTGTATVPTTSLDRRDIPRYQNTAVSQTSE